MVQVKGIPASSARVRWVAEENIHLTVKFLGEVDEGRVAGIGERLREVCTGHAPFGLTIEGTGAFPGTKNPRTLWVGVAGSEALANLARDIEQAMASLGFEKEERTFSPHLTIGRVRPGRVTERRGLDSIVKELATFKDKVFGTIQVEEILLMKSQLRPGGAEYSVVAGFQLKACE